MEAGEKKIGEDPQRDLKQSPLFIGNYFQQITLVNKFPGKACSHLYLYLRCFTPYLFNTLIELPFTINYPLLSIIRNSIHSRTRPLEYKGLKTALTITTGPWIQVLIRP